MPRIAATGIVLALVAMAIGLNMARYPAVWQMVEPPAQSSQPEETARPAEAPRPTMLAPVNGSRRDSAPEPLAGTSQRGAMTLPVSLGKTDSPAANPPKEAHAADDPAESHAEPLAEYRRQRDANGIAATANAPSPEAAAPSNAAAPPAPDSPTSMSKVWPAEAAASLRVIASPAPPMAFEGKKGDSPVFADTKSVTAPVESVERLTPVVRPVSVPTAPAADSDTTLRPLPPVDQPGAAVPAPLSPGILQPVYPSTGMR